MLNSFQFNNFKSSWVTVKVIMPALFQVYGNVWRGNLVKNVSFAGGI